MEDTAQLVTNYTVQRLFQAEDSAYLTASAGQIDDIYDEERIKIVRSMLNACIRAEYRANTPSLNELDNFYYKLKNRFQELQDNKKQFFFVTVNFDDTKVLDELKELKFTIKKRLQRIYIKDYIYCIEQRGESTDCIHGYHTHILFQTNKYKKLSEIIREFYQAFKNYVSDKQKVDVKVASHSFEPRLKYILGKKKDKEKLKKMEIDIIFRNQYNIDPHYTTNTDLYSLKN